MASPKKTAKKRRNQVKNPGLDKRLFSKIKQEFHDIDYADQLNDKDKAWLSNFMEEDLGANMKHKGKKIYKKDIDKKESYGRNNARNRDVYAISRAQGKVFQVFQEAIDEYLDNKYKEGYNPEDDIIELLDNAELLKTGEDPDDSSNSSKT